MEPSQFESIQADVKILANSLDKQSLPYIIFIADSPSLAGAQVNINGTMHECATLLLNYANINPAFRAAMVLACASSNS